MAGEHILTLLGLSLRGGRLAVGEEPVGDAAQRRAARLVLLAADASDNTRRRAARFAQTGECLSLDLPFSKAEMGRALGRPPVALAAMTDTGLAAALVRRLAELDPAQYGETAARMERKVQRAAQRREQKAAGTPHRPKRAVPSGPPPGNGHGPDRPRKEGARAGGRPPFPGGRAKGHPPHSAARTGERQRGETVPHRSRPPKDGRPRPKATAERFPHSRPVKKGKGSFRRKEG